MVAAKSTKSVIIHNMASSQVGSQPVFDRFTGPFESKEKIDPSVIAYKPYELKYALAGPNLTSNIIWSHPEETNECVLDAINMLSQGLKVGSAESNAFVSQTIEVLDKSVDTSDSRNLAISLHLLKFEARGRMQTGNTRSEYPSEIVERLLVTLGKISPLLEYQDSYYDEVKRWQVVTRLQIIEVLTSMNFLLNPKDRVAAARLTFEMVDELSETDWPFDIQPELIHALILIYRSFDARILPSPALYVERIADSDLKLLFMENMFENGYFVSLPALKKYKSNGVKTITPYSVWQYDPSTEAGKAMFDAEIEGTVEATTRRSLRSRIKKERIVKITQRLSDTRSLTDMAFYARELLKVTEKRPGVTGKFDSDQISSTLKAISSCASLLVHQNQVERQFYLETYAARLNRSILFQLGDLVCAILERNSSAIDISSESPEVRDLLYLVTQELRMDANLEKYQNILERNKGLSHQQ